MLEQYKTIGQQAQKEIVEKKSRFIATVRPVKTEEEAKAFIEEMKKKYWDATHNVFAYQIGQKNEIQRLVMMENRKEQQECLYLMYYKKKILKIQLL